MLKACVNHFTVEGINLRKYCGVVLTGRYV